MEERKTENSSLLPVASTYPQPLSVLWRSNHVAAYLVGGFSFLIASYYYYPWVNGYVVGGWLFTIGSAAFLYADLNEWWKNNRVGCFMYETFRTDYESQVAEYMEPESTLYGKYQRAENGLNFALSAVGSLLYLIGSILFIPRFQTMVLGTVVFIYGSLVIFLSQAWKVFRSGCVDETNLQNKSFRISNIKDLAALGVDACAGIGGFAYFIGSVYFLPSYDLTDADTILAATWFIVGGFFFSLSGLFLYYRYFFSGIF